MEINDIIKQKFGNDRYIEHFDIGPHTIAVFESYNKEIQYTPFVNGKKCTMVYNTLVEALVGLSCEIQIDEPNTRHALMEAIFKILDLDHEESI